ncbi:MAG TPA: hypothetical protein VF950_18350 [Planctomycetota bacterium]
MTGAFSATGVGEELGLGAAGVLAGDADFDSAGSIRLEGVLGVNLFGGNGGGINAVDDVEIESNGSIALQLDVVSTAGSVDIHAVGSVSSNGDITALAAGQSVSIDALGGITLDGDVTVNAADGVISLFSDNGNVEIGGLHSGFNVTWTANNGAIRDLNGAGLNVAASILTMNAAGGIGTLADPIETSVTNLTTTGGGDQFIVEANNVAVNLTSSGTISLTTLTGGILGSVTAQTAILNAPARINVSTDVDVLVATSGGNVTINEVDSVTVDINAGGTATVNLGAGTLSGSIAAATADVDAPTINLSTAVGTLTATGGSLTVVELDGLLLNDVVVTTATITAGGAITDADAGVNLTAASATLTGASISLNTAVGTLNASATSGDITIVEADNLLIGLLSALSGTVDVRLTAGSLTDANGGSDNVIALAFYAAATGIGTAADPIETRVDNVEADGDAGGVFLANQGDLVIGGVNGADGVDAGTGAGQIHVSTTGTLTIAEQVGEATSTGAITLAAGVDILQNADVRTTGDITVTAGRDIVMANGTIAGVSATTIEYTAGRNLFVSLLDANTATGIVFATAAAGYIEDVDAGNAADIRGFGAVLTAAQGIGITGERVDLEVSNVEADGGNGPIWLRDRTGTLTIGGVSPMNGVTSNGGPIRITADGDLILGERIDAGAGDVTLRSNTGAILDGNDGAIALTNVFGFQLILESVTGAGSAANPIETSVSQLHATNTTSGDIAVVNTGDLTALAVNNTGTGDVLLDVAGDLLIVGAVSAATGDVTITATAVHSTAASVSAGDQLSIQTQGDSTLDGTFSGDSVDIFSLGDLTVTGVFSATVASGSGEELSIAAAGVLAGDADFNSAGGIRLEGVLGVNLFGGSGGTIGAATAVSIESNGSIVLQQAITTTSGSVDIRAGGSVFSNEDISALAAGQAISIDALGGITLDGNVTVSAVSGVISLFSDNGNVEIGGLHSGFDVTWTANNGAIRDLNGAATNVTATNLAMNAATGIGTAADPIETNVANLTTSGGGDQFIAETDSVLVNASTNGTFSLTLAAGNLIGDITAQTAILSAPDFINVDTTVANLTATSGGSILIDETDSVSVVVNAGTTATINLGSGTLSGSITAATADVNAPTINLSTAVGTLTATGVSLTVVELDGLQLNDVVVTTATITAGGTITDADAGVNLTAVSVTLTGVQIGSAGDFLDTDVSDLTATATGLAPGTLGSLWINEASSLTAVNLTATGLGVINLTTGGFVTDNDADVDFAGNGVVVTATFFGTTANPIQTAVSSLNVTATAGDIIVTETDGLTALNLDAADDVVLVAGGAITAFGGGTDIFADTATITAPSINVDTDVNTLIATATAGDVVIDEVDDLDVTVTATGTADIDLATGELTGTITAAAAILSGPDGVDVQTAVGQLVVDSSDGDIDVFNTGNLLLTSASAPNGSINVGVFGTLVVDGSVTAGVDIELGSGADLVLIDALIDAGQNISIDAFGSIVVDNSGLTAVGVITLTSDAGIAMTDATLDADAITVVAAGAFSDLGGLWTTTNSGISISAAGLTLDSTNLDPTGDVFLFSTAGLDATNVSVTPGAGLLILAQGDTNLDGFFSANGIGVQTLGDLTVVGTMLSTGSIDLFAAGTFASDADFETVAGDVTINALQGVNLGGGFILADGSVSIESGGDLVISLAINAAGAVTIDGLGSVTLDDSIDAGGDVNVSAGDDLSVFGDIDTNDGSISLSADGALLISGVQVDADSVNGADLTINGGSVTVLNGDLRADGLITITAVGAMALTDSDLDTDLDIVLTAGGALAVAGGSLSSDLGDIDLSAAGDIAVIDVLITAAGDIEVVGEGAVRLSGSTLTADVSITVHGGPSVDLDQAFLNALGGIIDVRGGDLRLVDSSLTAGGRVDVAAETGFLYSNSTNYLSFSQRVFLFANGDLTVDAGGLISPVEVVFQALGDVSLYNVDAYDGTIRVLAGLDATLDDVLFDNIQALVVEAGGDVAILVREIDASGDITVDAGGSITVTADSAAAASLASGDDIRLTAGGNVVISDADADATFATLSAADEVRVTAGGSIEQATGQLVATDLVLYAATGISILVADVDFLQATNSISGALVVYNASGLTILDIDGLGYGVENEGGDIVIESGISGPVPGPSPILVADPISGSGRITIEADGDLTIDADVYGTEIVLEANGEIDQTGGTISGYTLEAEATNGIDLTAVAVNAAQLLNTAFGDVAIVGLGDLVLTDLNGNGYAIRNTAGAVSVTAAGDLEIASDLAANGAVTLLAAAGSIEQTGGLLSGTALTATAASGIDLGLTDVDSLTASTTSTGTIFVSNLGNMTVTAVTAADGDVTLRATLGGDLLLGTVTALGHTVTLEAAGDVDEFNPDVNPDVTALHVVITAGDGIGDAGTIEIDVVRATLTVTAVGGIDVLDTANGLDLLGATAPGGVVRIVSAGGPLIARLVVAGDDAFVSTTGAGDVVLGLVQAVDQATISSAAGSILDGNDQNGEALNVQTGGEAFMSAAVVIGTLADCVEIQIGGNLTLFAGGSIGGVSISLCGTTGGANPVIVIGGPGLSTVNGLEFLPLLQSARAAMNDLLDIRRRYDPILQHVLGDTTIWPPEMVEDQRPGAPTKPVEPKLPGESAEKKD